MLLLLTLLACTSPAEPDPWTVPTPGAPSSKARVPGTPDLDVLAAWLAPLDGPPERHEGVLRVGHTGEHATFAVHVQPMPDEDVVYLATSELITLRDAAGERGIVLLLTTMAALNYETLEGKLQLNAATGDVILSIELPTDDGLGRATFQDAVRTLGATADRLVPELREAALGASL